MSVISSGSDSEASSVSCAYDYFNRAHDAEGVYLEKDEKTRSVDIFSKEWEDAKIFRNAKVFQICDKCGKGPSELEVAIHLHETANYIDAVKLIMNDLDFAFSADPEWKLIKPSLAGVLDDSFDRDEVFIGDEVVRSIMRVLRVDKQLRGFRALHDDYSNQILGAKMWLGIDSTLLTEERDDAMILILFYCAGDKAVEKKEYKSACESFILRNISRRTEILMSWTAIRDLTKCRQCYNALKTDSHTAYDGLIAAVSSLHWPGGLGCRNYHFFMSRFARNGNFIGPCSFRQWFDERQQNPNSWET